LLETRKSRHFKIDIQKCFGYTDIHHHLKSESEICFFLTLVNVLKDSNSFCYTREIVRELLNLLMITLPYSYLHFIAELRRPDGPPSGAPYSYRKEKETHELICSWLSWLAVLLAGAYARRRRRRRRRRRNRATWRPYSK